MVGGAGCRAGRLRRPRRRAARPGGGRPARRRSRRVEALVQQAFVGQLVDHAGVAHQVLHRPARQAQQAQQAAQHLGPLGQQGQVAVAAQQRFEPVDEAQGGGLGAVAVVDAGAGALDQPAQAQLALVAQRQHARLLAPGRMRSASRAAALEQASLSMGSGPGPQFLQPLRRTPPWAPVVQQRVELIGHQLADLAQPVSSSQACGGRRVVAQAQRAGDPGQVGVVGRQQVGLLVVQVLDAVLHLAQEHIGLVELRAVSGFISPRPASRCRRPQRERVRISGNCPPRTTSSSCTMNSISRMPPRESFTSLARSGRPAARRWASSRILRCSWRRPSKMP
jgi:hypothetical protein